MMKGISEIELFADLETELDRVKWYLWHGNVFQALQVLDGIELDLETANDSMEAHDKLIKRTQVVREFYGYIEGIALSSHPNYGKCYRYGEPIASAFVASTINEVVRKRMVKKQQMR